MSATPDGPLHARGEKQTHVRVIGPFHVLNGLSHDRDGICPARLRSMTRARPAGESAVVDSERGKRVRGLINVKGMRLDRNKGDVLQDASGE